MTILYDESHGEPNLEEYYSGFSRYMTSKGFRIDVLHDSKLLKERLDNFKVFMVSFPQEKFSNEDIKKIVNFVGEGGGLFLVGEEGDFGGFKSILNSISENFGITFNDDEVHDPTDSIAESYSIIHTMEEHPIIKGVSKFVVYGGCSLNVSGQAKVVASGDDDTYSTKGYYKAGEYPPVLAVSEYLKGRVVCIGDGSLLRNRFINEYYNKQLGLNIIEWLVDTETVQEPEKRYTREDILREIDELEKKYSSLREKYSKGEIDDDQYRKKIAEYGGKLEKLETMLSGLK
jgi:uncharacterized membrane protein